MKASRGRLSQYRILRSEMSLAKHLIDTEPFNKATFFKFADNHKAVVIKPVFGSGEIRVSIENNKFEISTNTNVTTIMRKDEAFQYLASNELKQKYYIIQPTKLHASFFQRHFQYTATVHRKSASAEWCFISKPVFNIFLYLGFLQRIEKLSVSAATKLGEFFPECHTVVIEMLYDLKGGIWIQDTSLHFPTSKWSQYHTLTLNRSLKSFVPDTELLTRVTFHEFLNKYDEVIIKPCYGQNGLGIVQISINKQLSYEIHAGKTKLMKSTIDEVYHYIEEHYLSKKDYLVQQKLSLASISDCPFDVRVIVQKVNSNWQVTGKAVKVAGKSFFITNAAQKVLPLENAIQDSNISHLNVDRLESEIDEICISAARQLEESKAKIKIVGFDIGITVQGDIRIIEGNYIPDISMFYLLEDKQIYRNILKTIRNSNK